VEIETAGDIIGLGEAPTHNVAPLIRENFADRFVSVNRRSKFDPSSASIFLQAE
jgi:hypothetical protein